MIYLFQFLLVVFYFVFVIRNSNKKQKKRSFNESKADYQKMIDKKNKKIKNNKTKNSKSLENKTYEDLIEKYYDNKNMSKKEKEKALKKELANKLSNRKTLLESNQEKLNKLGVKPNNDEVIKSNLSSKIIDRRSMENAAEHEDDSIYSHSLIEECEFDHKKDDELYSKYRFEDKKSKITKEKLQDAVIMKEILDAPVSMR